MHPSCVIAVSLYHIEHNLIHPSQPMSKSLAYLAFETLTSSLNPGAGALTIKEINEALGHGDYPTSSPLFVTWNKNGQLRGCIGTFLALAIEKGVPKYALISAFEDPRFPPITRHELSQLSVSITILDKFERISDPNDWEIGTHGLKVLFGHHLGTFLPSVAEEQEWDKVETLWNLLRKAGYSGISASKTLDYYEKALADGSMELTRYRGLKCGADYDEYVSFRRSLEN